MITLFWQGIHQEIDKLCGRIPPDTSGIYGIPTGGSFVALLVSHQTGLPVLDVPRNRCLVVDDLIDTGDTMRRFDKYARDALYRKPHSPIDLCPYATQVDDWITFPWEHDTGPADAVTRLLEYDGPSRELNHWLILKDEPHKETVILDGITQLRQIVERAWWQYVTLV